MSGIPTLDQLGQYNVNRPNDVEGIKWDLYDSITYPTTGVAQMQFFQIPQGQSGKTLADTNMTSAGALPSPQAFLVQTIQLMFLPTADAISTYGAAAASAFVNDTYKWWSSKAWLELYIGSKAYLDVAPLLKFPPENGLSGFSAASDTTTAAASGQTLVAYASAGGPIYEVDPPLLLTPTQNFKVTLNWPSLVTVTGAATVYCNLGGALYRNSQ